VPVIAVFLLKQFSSIKLQQSLTINATLSTSSATRVYMMLATSIKLRLAVGSNRWTEERYTEFPLQSINKLIIYIGYLYKYLLV